MTGTGVIVMLLTGLGVGGAERQAIHLARHLKQSGHDISLVSMVEPLAFQAELDDLNIPLESLGMQRGVPSLLTFLQFVRGLKATRPDVLLCFMYHANLMGRLAGKLAGVPKTIVSVRNEYFGGPARERLFRGTNWLSESTVVNSVGAADSLVSRGVVDPGQLIVVPNGIVVDRVVPIPVPRKDMGLPDDGFVWLAVGRLELQKDYPNLLKAFAKTGRDSDHLLIVGEGTERPTIEKLIQELALGGRVHLLGRRADVPELLVTADAMVLASAWEGLPNVIMESLLLGVPVVSTDVGGVRELVTDRISGYLVPPGNSDALARALCTLAELQPTERAELGKAGRRHVREHYEIGRIMGLWDNLLSGKSDD